MIKNASIFLEWINLKWVDDFMIIYVYELECKVTKHTTMTVSCSSDKLGDCIVRASSLCWTV